MGGVREAYRYGSNPSHGGTTIHGFVWKRHMFSIQRRLLALFSPRRQPRRELQTTHPARTTWVHFDA